MFARNYLPRWFHQILFIRATIYILDNVWAKKTGRDIHAVTVDHGLRAEAAAEAAFVAMVCDRLDIVVADGLVDRIDMPEFQAFLDSLGL